jgi:hypothetical protein
VEHHWLHRSVDPCHRAGTLPSQSVRQKTRWQGGHQLERNSAEHFELQVSRRILPRCRRAL